MNYKKIVEELFLISMLIFLILIGFWKLSEMPYWTPDEFWHGVFAVDILGYGIIKYIITVPFLIGYYNGPLHYYTLIPSLKFFGYSIQALRTPSLIIGTLTWLLMYLFTREFFNKKTAFFTSLLMVITPAYFLNSRSAYEFILLPFFAVLALYLLNKYNEVGNKKYLYLFSLVCGLGLISKLNFLFFILSLVLALKFCPIFKRIKKISKNCLIAMLLFFLIGIYPLIFFNVRTDFHFVKEMVESFPKTPYGHEDLSNIPSNIKTSLLDRFPNFVEGDIIYITEPLKLYNIPLLSLIFIFSLMYLSISILSKHHKIDFKSRKDMFMIINFFSIFILASTLTVNIFDSRTYIIILPFFVIIIGRTFYEASEICRKFNKYYFIDILLIIIVISSGVFYFRKFFLQAEEHKESIDYECIICLDKVVNSVLNLNHSNIMIDDEMGGYSRMFKWYLYKRNLYDENISFLTHYENVNLDENSLYITSTLCLPPFTTGMSRINFFNTLDNRNKTVVTEDEIYSKSGELLYTIYRIT